MAVVEPMRTPRQQLRLGLSMVVGGLVVSVVAGVAGPIVLAILIGAIWGSH